MARAWWVAWAPSPWPGRWLTPVGPRAGAQARCWWWCSRATLERPGPRLVPVPAPSPPECPCGLRRDTWPASRHGAEVCTWALQQSVPLTSTRQPVQGIRLSKRSQSCKANIRRSQTGSNVEMVTFGGKEFYFHIKSDEPVIKKEDNFGGAPGFSWLGSRVWVPARSWLQGPGSRD